MLYVSRTVINVHKCIQAIELYSLVKLLNNLKVCLSLWFLPSKSNKCPDNGDQFNKDAYNHSYRELDMQKSSKTLLLN